MHTTPRVLCPSLSNSNPVHNFRPMKFKKAETSSNEASNWVRPRHTSAHGQARTFKQSFLASAILFLYLPITPSYVHGCRFPGRDALIGNARKRAVIFSDRGSSCPSEQSAAAQPARPAHPRPVFTLPRRSTRTSRGWPLRCCTAARSFGATREAKATPTTWRLFYR